jgi:uncharacterized phage-associated protein
MNYMRLLKLLYLAERECLRDSGQPLTGSPVVAMKRGPVLDEVYALIRNQHPMTPAWSRFFHVDHYHLVMDCDPGIGKLTRFLTSKLSDVAERHRNDDEWAMVEFSHTLPEWIKNNPGDSCRPISVRDILEAIGRIDQMDRIIEHDRHAAAMTSVFADCVQTDSDAIVSEGAGV